MSTNLSLDKLYLSFNCEKRSSPISLPSYICSRIRHPVDLPQRLEYCQWFLNTLDVHLDKTFCTDEAYFHLSGYVISQNTRMWSSENPYFFIETPQYPQKVGVWAAISQHRIIGPIFLEGNNCNNV
jgi:hypothetical protein